MTVEHNQEIPKLLIDRYPTEESIDPVNAITALLAEAGHPEPQRWLQGLDAAALDANTPQDYRRFLVNRHWRPILGMATEDSSVARYCLMDTGPMYTWLLLFKESVVPFAVKHNLPQNLW